MWPITRNINQLELFVSESTFFIYLLSSFVVKISPE
jgi:hypothetical protein